MPKITKEDIAVVIANSCGCSKSAGTECLNAILEEIKKNLKAGKDVVLTGFGTFSTTHRKARIGRNPQTGASLKIPAKIVPKFKAGKGLKDAVK